MAVKVVFAASALRSMSKDWMAWSFKKYEQRLDGLEFQQFICCSLKQFFTPAENLNGFGPLKDFQFCEVSTPSFSTCLEKV
jgi:hypothetical protein